MAFPLPWTCTVSSWAFSAPDQFIAHVEGINARQLRPFVPLYATQHLVSDSGFLHRWTLDGTFSPGDTSITPMWDETNWPPLVFTVDQQLAQGYTWYYKVLLAELICMGDSPYYWYLLLRRFSNASPIPSPP